MSFPSFKSAFFKRKSKKAIPLKSYSCIKYLDIFKVQQWPTVKFAQFSKLLTPGHQSFPKVLVRMCFHLKILKDTLKVHFW